MQYELDTLNLVIKYDNKDIDNLMKEYNMDNLEQ